MAGKKAAKKMPMVKISGFKDDPSDFGMLEIYLLIIIGFIGLIKNFVTIYPLPEDILFFMSMLVFVIGVTKLINRTK